MRTTADSSVPDVVVLVATFRRVRELKRLIHCLSHQSLPIAGMVVADNGAEVVCADAVAASPFPTRYLALKENEGCGAGLRAAEIEAGSAFPSATHWWILDDDAVPGPGCLSRLVDALQRANCGMAVPLLTDVNHSVWAFPEPEEKAARQIMRASSDPIVLLDRLGPGPHRACWATGACQLVCRDAAEAVGLHRTDFWMLGEDLEFSMRVAVHSGLCFVTDELVPHLPPPAPDARLTAPKAAAGDRKFRALIQNLSYISVHCRRHSAHMWRYVPGNVRRYLRDHRWSLTAMRDATICVWNGAVLGRPAGFAMSRSVSQSR